MTVKHNCPNCQCVQSASRALEFEPTLNIWLSKTLLPADPTTELTTNDIYSAYAAWCRRDSRQPALTQSRLTRHLRTRGYRFKHYGSMNKILGCRLAT